MLQPVLRGVVHWNYGQAWHLYVCCVGGELGRSDTLCVSWHLSGGCVGEKRGGSIVQPLMVVQSSRGTVVPRNQAWRSVCGPCCIQRNASGLSCFLMSLYLSLSQRVCVCTVWRLECTNYNWLRSFGMALCRSADWYSCTFRLETHYCDKLWYSRASLIWALVPEQNCP